MTTIHFPLEGWREQPKPFGKEINMLKLRTKIYTERGGAGRKATEPMVTISENGQLGFNSLVIPALRGFQYALLFSDDNPKRKETEIKLTCFATPKTWPVKLKGIDKAFGEREVAKLHWSQVKDDVAHACNITMSADLRDMGYDYKTSRGQKFQAKVEGNSVTFTVPVGSLTPKPRQQRQTRNKGVNGLAGQSASAAAELTELIAG